MDAKYKTTLEPNSTEYPASLRHCVVHEHPSAITALGNLDLLHNELLGFFCSVRCPGHTILKTFVLESPDNAHFLELGTVPVQTDDPMPLIAREDSHTHRFLLNTPR